MVLTGTLAAIAGAQEPQSLGDYARAMRKEKKTTTPARKFDNDNLPRTDVLSVVGKADSSNQGDSDSGQTANAGDAQAQSSQMPTAITPGQPPEERQKAYSEWKDKISEQKKKIELLSRELDVTQREYKLRAAAFYADAGNRLRNAAAWDKEDAQYKKQIEDKQKAVDRAKTDLDDLQEQARKAGVPSSVRE